MLSDCKTVEKGFHCLNTCESVWFKIWNTTAAGTIVDACDKEFIGQYANVMCEIVYVLNIGNTIASMDHLMYFRW